MGCKFLGFVSSNTSLFIPRLKLKTRNNVLQKRREDLEKLEKEKQADLRSYKNLMVAEKMTSNKDIESTSKSVQELEDDFM